ncbi:Mitogen-activated protein kinase-binding protein 1 [Amphibalanus amphitrite]|uniref:Mitogen-activated protein kinase-binding protein 1 n=1 Tax=Amphibalanus amphitrite TaxID=1232801 RepID=A0A6A4VTB1_AMPAM|nr:Mitogen-activated protein kinase-binding protein 1 [Amphibalanus amphitrite]
MAKEDPPEGVSGDPPPEGRTEPVHQIRLERVLGVTVSSNAAVDVSPTEGIVAYPAGCTVVLYNPKKNKQSHLLNTSRKPITSVRFSADGRYLVTGECGHQPAVRVWSVQDKVLLQEFLVHKYGITCVGFSPGNKYVVSVGFQHDMIVNVWDWQRNVKVASNKVSSRVKAVSFAENGSYFVTVGNRHVKFWYLELSRSSKFKEAMPLTGRSAILGEQRNNYFCDVACGRGEMGDSTYAITRSGLLCEFNNRRLLDKWVELRTQTANCMTAGEQLIFIGCADGIVRCFSPHTLQFVTTLPRTHYLGVDLARGLAISHMAAHPAGSRYPDCVGVTYDETAHKVGKSHSFLYHSACIWGVETYPQLRTDTIRVWNLDPNMPNNTVYKRNIYSNDLLKILYIDPSLQYLKDVDQGSRENADKTDPNYDCKNGVRCIKISPDGKQLASGDRQGNIRVHELQFMDELCKIEAHDAEVLCLEFSRPDSGWRLLSSASRDRLIHLFNADQDYQFLQTLDDHSSSITAVRFFQHQERLFMVSCGADKSVIFRQAALNAERQLQFALSHNVVGKTTLYDMEVDHSQRHILTACQDRNIRVYNVSNGKHSKTFKGSIADDGTLIKLSMDQSGIYVATSCTDKTLYVYDYHSGDCMASMFGHSELVTGLRFTNDCRHLITVSGDGCVFVWRVPHDMTQTMLARLQQQARRSRRRQTHSAPPPTDAAGTVPLHMFDSNANERDGSDYRFSPGGLPQWAKRKVTETSVSPTNERTVDFPKGRWAQRIDSAGMTVKSIYDRDSVIPFPGQDRRRAGQPDSEGSKDSSLEDSTTASSREQSSRPLSRSSRRSELIEARNRPLTDDSSDLGSYRPDDGTTDHDGDIDDYSEPESTENEAAETPMYYPQPTDDGASSPFTVNAMDQEELRRSVRRARRPRPAHLTLAPLAGLASDAGTATQDDSDDLEEEEEVSTPSADTDGQTRAGLHTSASMESIDKIGQHEKFLAKNFESLDGEDEPAEGAGESPNHKNSISSKFLVGRSYASTTVRSQESQRKREELQRRIQETRRKLQGIGYRSGNLKASQSYADLSYGGSPGRAGGRPPYNSASAAAAAAANSANRLHGAGTLGGDVERDLEFVFAGLACGGERVYPAAYPVSVVYPPLYEGAHSDTDGGRSPDAAGAAAAGARLGLAPPAGGRQRRLRWRQTVGPTLLPAFAETPAAAAAPRCATYRREFPAPDYSHVPNLIARQARLPRRPAGVSRQERRFRQRCVSDPRPELVAAALRRRAELLQTQPGGEDWDQRQEIDWDQRQETEDWNQRRGRGDWEHGGEVGLGRDRRDQQHRRQQSFESCYHRKERFPRKEEEVVRRGGQELDVGSQQELEIGPEEPERESGTTSAWHGMATHRRVVGRAPLSFVVVSLRTSAAGAVDPEPAGGLRRAVSLSDLTDASTPRRLLPSTPAVSGKKTPSKKQPRPSSALARSSSMNLLNQTDSDSGLSRSSRTVGSPMRPTIASLNKQKAPASAATSYRRGLSGAVSVGDMRALEADSSSEEPLSPSESRGQTGPFKGRASSVDRLAASRLSGAGGRGGAGSERDLSRAAREVTSRLTATVTKTRQQTVTKRQTVTLKGYGVRESSPDTDWDALGSEPQPDLSSVPLTRELCELELFRLQRQAERVLQLAHRLSDEPPSEPAGTELPLLLRSGAAACLAALQPVAAPAGKAGPLPDLPPAAAANPAMVQMMQQYSDALLTMMHQRMQPPG